MAVSSIVKSYSPDLHVLFFTSTNLAMCYVFQTTCLLHVTSCSREHWQPVDHDFVIVAAQQPVPDFRAGNLGEIADFPQISAEFLPQESRGKYRRFVKI